MQELSAATKHSDENVPPPEASYNDELRRVSKNQIIWGANPLF
jgi:hypothetical protein